MALTGKLQRDPASGKIFRLKFTGKFPRGDSALDICCCGAPVCAFCPSAYVKFKLQSVGNVSTHWDGTYYLPYKETISPRCVYELICQIDEVVNGQPAKVLGIRVELKLSPTNRLVLDRGGGTICRDTLPGCPNFGTFWIPTSFPAPVASAPGCDQTIHDENVSGAGNGWISDIQLSNSAGINPHCL
jgi:hypothetical protein